MNRVGMVAANEAHAASTRTEQCLTALLRARQYLAPLLVILSFGLWGLFLKMTLPDAAVGLYDFRAYWNGSQALLHNLNLYRTEQFVPGAPFVYPPISAMVLLPFTALPLPTAEWVWYFFSLALVGIGCANLIELVGFPRSILPNRELALAALAIIAFFFYPVWTNTKLGQVSGLVFCFVVAALLAHSKRQTFAAGILLGSASALKLTPLPLIAFVILVGWRRFGGIALATFSALMLVSAIFVPEQFAEYWLKIVPGIGNLNEGINISTTALVARLAPQLSSALLPIAAIISASAVLIPFVLAWRTRDLERQVLLFALLLIGLAIAGPLTHNHYMIWLLLPIWILFTHFVRERQLFGLYLLGGTFLLLSQPFRLLRIIQAITRAEFSTDAYGGAVLQAAAILLYVLTLVVILKWRGGVPAETFSARTEHVLHTVKGSPSPRVS